MCCDYVFALFAEYMSEMYCNNIDCSQRNMLRGFRGEGPGLVVRREVVFSLQRGPYVHGFPVMVAAPCGFLWIS